MASVQSSQLFGRSCFLGDFLTEWGIVTFHQQLPFKRASNSIHRGTLFEILWTYGVPMEKLIQTISAMYSKARAKVCSLDGNTMYFELKAWVLQGETLAPFLFVIALDYALRLAISGRQEELGFTLQPCQSCRVPRVMVTNLDFTDGIARLSDIVEKARDILLAVARDYSWTLRKQRLWPTT